MNLTRTLGISLEVLMGHKLRTLLSSSGIAIGVGLLLEGCDKDVGLACDELASYLDGRGESRRAEELYAKAGPLLLAACDRGDMDSCLQVTSELIRGQGIPADPARAVANHRAAT